MKKGLLSIIIPSRNDLFLQRTIDNLLSNATGDVEIIVVLDGYWPNVMINENKRVITIHHGALHDNYGMRKSINKGVQCSDGEYIMKIDEHCCVDNGYDTKLKEDCEDNWVVVPRRRPIDRETWELDPNRPAIDNMFLTPPVVRGHGLGCKTWHEWGKARRAILIDDCMTMQGSCYFMKRKHWDWLGGLDSDMYGPFHFEPQEVVLKTWLGGGRVVTNKKTWYGHRRRHSNEKLNYSFSTKQSFTLSNEAKGAFNEKMTDYWVNNRWENRVRDFDWLIERFWPVPHWPENWKNVLREANIIKTDTIK